MFLVLRLAKTSSTCKMNVCLGNRYAADFTAKHLRERAASHFARIPNPPELSGER
jgi:hypothetical protein